MAKKVNKLRRDIRWLEEDFKVAYANYDLICAKWNQVNLSPAQVLANLKEKLQAYEELDAEEGTATGILQASTGTTDPIQGTGRSDPIGTDVNVGESSD